MQVQVVHDGVGISRPWPRSAPRVSFTPRYPLETLPLWIATGSDAAAAAAACSTSFTGAPAQLAQYVDGTGFDADLVCGKPATAKPTAPSAPTSLTARTDARRGVTLDWSAPASDGGAPVQYYTVRRGGSATGTSPYAKVVCTARTCTWRDTATTRDATYFYTVTATTSAGTGAAPAAVSAQAR